MQEKGMKEIDNMHEKGIETMQEKGIETMQEKGMMAIETIKEKRIMDIDRDNAREEDIGNPDIDRYNAREEDIGYPDLDIYNAREEDDENRYNARGGNDLVDSLVLEHRPGSIRSLCNSPDST